MDSIIRIQEALLKEGFNPGPIDGMMGPKTKAAMVAFLKSKGHNPRHDADRWHLVDLCVTHFSENAKAYLKSPFWVHKALSYLGLKEFQGKRHNEKILYWWKKINAKFNDDETPWCAGFVGGVLEECNIRSSRSAAARSYCKWGVLLAGPAVGAVVVFWRGKPSGWSGHVGFVIGKDQFGNLMVLGGNQGNAVTVKPFSRKRVLGYYWPKEQVLPMKAGFDKLPLVNSSGVVSTNEA